MLNLPFDYVKEGMKVGRLERRGHISQLANDVATVGKFLLALYCFYVFGGAGGAESTGGRRGHDPRFQRWCVFRWRRHSEPLASPSVIRPSLTAK